VIELPDVPRWIEAHGIASDPAGWREPVGGGFALGHDRARLIVVAGDAEPGEVAKLAAARPHYTLLFAIDREDLAAAMRRTRRAVARAILHTLADPAALPDLEGAIALPPDASLAHLPAALTDELAGASTTVWTTIVDDKPVAFAYAPWRSAKWFDISIDTLPGFRQLGLGSLVAAAMIRDEMRQGRQAVWGSDESNAASLRLAKRLGFTPVDEIGVAAPNS